MAVRPGAASPLSRLARRHARSTASVALLIAVLLPFAWMVQMGVSPGRRRAGAEPGLQPHAGASPGCGRTALRLFGNSLLASTLSTGLVAAAGRAGAHVALARHRRHVALWIPCTPWRRPSPSPFPSFGLSLAGAAGHRLEMTELESATVIGDEQNRLF